jgi:alpha-glucosidase
MKTVKQASNPFGLVVAPDALGNAAGSLFLDDGATLQVGSNSLQATFAYSNGTLTYALQANGYAPASALRFVDVNVLGCSVALTAAIADGQAVNVTVTYEADTQVATADLNLPLNAPFTIVIT